MSKYERMTFGAKATAILLAVVLLLSSTGTAWAVYQHSWRGIRAINDDWYYAFADSKGEEGYENRTAYNTPTGVHCVRLKSNGSWRKKVVETNGKAAKASDKNTVSNPQPYVDYDASIGYTAYQAQIGCMAVLASSIDENVAKKSASVQSTPAAEADPTGLEDAGADSSYGAAADSGVAAESN